MSEYLGISGKVGHGQSAVDKYNALLKLIGSYEMLIQFERWANDEEIECLIRFVEDNLFENGVPLPYNRKFIVEENHVTTITNVYKYEVYAKSEDEAIKIARSGDVEPYIEDSHEDSDHLGDFKVVG